MIMHKVKSRGGGMSIVEGGVEHELGARHMLNFQHVAAQGCEEQELTHIDTEGGVDRAPSESEAAEAALFVFTRMTIPTQLSGTRWVTATSRFTASNSCMARNATMNLGFRPQRSIGKWCRHHPW